MSRSPYFGVALATFGALILTPDTLFMRWSEMSGLAMLAWRGLLMGTVLLLLWPLTRRTPVSALRDLVRPTGIGVILCHAANATLFALAIAVAPVPVVLLSVATVPIFAALFGRLLLGETTRAATWVTMAAVLAGIAIAVLGRAEGGPAGGRVILGVAAGLGVAVVMSLNFVFLRQSRNIPIQPAIGIGALIAGAAGLMLAGPGTLTEGLIWPIAVTGAVILPLSFLALTHATRHTSATNVSLLLLLETVLGPLWVWLGADEPLTLPMLLGGTIVIGSLALYLRGEARRTTG